MSIELSAGLPAFIQADGDRPIKLIHAVGDTVYYSSNRSVLPNQEGSIVAGGSQTFVQSKWLYSAAGARLETSFPPATDGINRGTWTANTFYARNDMVTNSGTFYRANSDHVSPTVFDAADWTSIGPGGGFDASIFTARGDSIAGNGSGSYSVVHVGANGTVPIANSAVAGGYSWGSGVPQGLQVITAGNLGASYTPALASQKDTLLTGTLNANCTLGSPTGGVAGATLTMEITQSAAYSLTLFTSLKPGGNIALSGAAGAVDVLTAYTPDGTNWRVFLAGAGMT